MGKHAETVHVGLMGSNGKSDKLSSFIAEEVLRAIYGDDYQGCTVSLEQIATVVQKALQQQGVQSEDLLELYEKVVEAVDLLSTPPDPSKVTDPDQLRTLLGERLDGIHAVTTKTIKTAALVRGTTPSKD